MNKLSKLIKYSMMFHADVVRFTHFLRSEWGFDILKLVTLEAVMKFLRLIIMFLPIKVFLYLSNFETANHFGINLTESDFIVISMVSLVLVYVVILSIQTYSGRLAFSQSRKYSEDKSHEFKTVIFGKRKIIEGYRRVVALISSFVIIFVSILVFIFQSSVLAVSYIILLFVYIWVVDYFTYYDSRNVIFRKLKINANSFISITTSIVYLMMFFVLFLIFKMQLIRLDMAILSFFLCRVSVGAMSTLCFSSYKLKLLIQGVRE